MVVPPSKVAWFPAPRLGAAGMASSGGQARFVASDTGCLMQTRRTISAPLGAARLTGPTLPMRDPRREDPTLDDQIARARAYEALHVPALLSRWCPRVLDAAGST